MSKAQKRLLIPAHLRVRSGNKVSWYYFETEDEAKAAAKVAKHNAKIAEDEGYDFGYQCPGTIRKMPPVALGELAGLENKYEVCFP